jgi:hypothetical protein
MKRCISRRPVRLRSGSTNGERSKAATPLARAAPTLIGLVIL